MPKLLYILFWQISMTTIGFCQNGFLSLIMKEQNMNINIDDILYHEDRLFVRGNILLDSIGQFGAFVAELDTFANLLDIHAFYDSSLAISIISNTPTRFTITNNDYFLMPNFLFQKNELNFIVLNDIREIVFYKSYVKPDLTVFPFEAFQVDSFYYLFGYVQRTNFLADDYIMKIDKNGNEVWFKYLGNYNLNEWLGAVIPNSDKTFTISSHKSSKEYYPPDELIGWRKPWIYTVDTSGTIIWQWQGEENDERTKGGGPFHRQENGNWMVISQDPIEMNFGTYSEVWTSPTVSLLDSSFNLIRKDTLIDFAFYQNKIVDMDYDPIRREYVLVGDRYFEYEEVESEIWVIKLNDNGEKIWEITDTLTYHNKEIHYTAGVAISNTGSIYVTGYYQSQVPQLHTDGWLMKVTADGCIDSLCNLSSIATDISNQLVPFLIYPNPAKDILFVKNNYISQELNLQAFNMQGELLAQTTMFGESGSISLNYPPGMYIIRGFWGDGKAHSQKFFITN